MTIKRLLKGVAILPIVLIGIILLIVAKVLKIFGLCMIFDFNMAYQELLDIWVIESTLG